MDDASPAIRVGETRDGTLTYLVDLSPEALPPVRGRDLEAAWDAARAGAGAARWGGARLFRFRRGDGSTTDLALADPDACCWARAVDALVGMQTSYGLSLCLRLLALVDLLARAPRLRRALGAAGMLALGGGEAELHPRLLRAAATLPLTAEARFDESGFHATIAALPAPLRSGVSA